MKLGIFAKIFAGTAPREVLATVRRAGYRAVQYNLACSGLGPLPEAVRGEDADAVAAAAALAGVEISAVSATYNMVHPDPRQRRRGREGFAAVAGAAGRLGCRLLTVCTGSLDPGDQWRYHPDNAGGAAWRELCLECERLVTLAEAYDLCIGVEPELANVVDTPRRARALLEEMGSDRIRIVLDPANLFQLASPPQARQLVEAAVDLLGDRIALAHAKDRDAQGRVTAVGGGVVDFRHYLKALSRAGYRGSLVAHGFPEARAVEVAAFLSAELEALERGP
ncbi:MAG TPA: sugar phosphate isomerase/epimerase [Anaeromyxobacteraceae bacterium]|nr:sugar phosphate isomerase/epimerase [Anaeromyxobacteraceae bacterium]